MNYFEESSKYFKSPLQEFVFYNNYSRFRYDLGRRETWIETVDRTVQFLKDLSKNKLDDGVYNLIRDNILNLKVMPSMRAMAMGGEAAHRNHFAIYNCSFLTLNSIDSLAEIMLLSMAGVGVGYSVQKKYTELLPNIPKEFSKTDEVYTIEDTTEGWVDALRYHLNKLMLDGEIIEFDYSQIRPAGSILKVKGGRASGPDVLKEAIDFTTYIITMASVNHDKLRPIDLHDIACAIGYCSISGGVRRTALISLFDADDEDMLTCKNDLPKDMWHYRWFANNSAVWEDEPELEAFEKQMHAMFDGNTGEPGIFSLKNAVQTAPKRRDGSKIKGLNPCGEVTLRDMQTCNLSSVICREDDDIQSLSKKIYVATIIGTIQSMADEFKNVRPEWELNQKEERLLGVDLNGQMDCPILRDDKYGIVHGILRDLAVETNKLFASILGINQAAAVTAVKPNGNSSQLVDSASGLHPRHSQYYIRNVRVSVHSPVYKVLFEAGVPMSPENGEDWSNIKTAVVHFPVKSPDGAKTRNDFSAVDMCNFWKLNKQHYTEMNPSVTINYREDEKEELKEWVWKNRMIVGGMAFLPYSDASYDNMPYVEITKEEYEKLNSDFPKIDWSRIEYYENEDMTEAAQQVACMSGSCEI